MSTTQQISTGLLFPGGTFTNWLDTIPGLIRWPFQEPDGATVARAKVSGVYNTAYDSSIVGATVAQPFGGNIPYAYSFDGNNDYVGIYSAALNTVWDGSKGTAIVFVEIPAAVWIDGLGRLILSMRVSSGANYVDILKHTANNSLRYRYNAGGTSEDIIYTSGAITTPMMVASTWDKDADSGNGEFKAFLNNTQVGTTQAIAGVYAGALSPTQCVIGAFNTIAELPYSGLITEPILHPTRAMTPAEISEIYQRSGI
jgi:hypothetical protein